MINPWTRNPWLSLWLSAANQSIGAVQGASQAALKRQVAGVQADATRQMLEFWAPAAHASRPAATRRKSRRR